jgi:hypothetical protein
LFSFLYSIKICQELKPLPVKFREVIVAYLQYSHPITFDL